MGPEILLRLLADAGELPYRAIVVAERSVLAAYAKRLGVALPGFVQAEAAEATAAAAQLVLVDPVGVDRVPRPGEPGRDDAIGALAALDAGAELVAGGGGDALVTCPLSKSSIAEHASPGFVGHTDYLAHKAGLERYGRDYLMTFLAADLKVALLTTHLPLRQALAADRTGRPGGGAGLPASLTPGEHRGGRPQSPCRRGRATRFRG